MNPDLEKLIREQFSYCSTTGVITRRTKTECTAVMKGQQVTFVRSSASTGYSKKHRNTAYVVFDLRPHAREVRAHRIAWFLTYGEWPETIDHISGDGSDNRLCNLRAASNPENAKNRRPRFGKQKGFISNTPRQGKPRYQARIQDNGKIHYLGTFDSKEEAARQYDQAALRLHGEFARLNYPHADHNQ